MHVQSKKPEAATSDFSKTISSLDELLPLNAYEIESDILSDQRSSTELEPLQNGRISHALVGKWGLTTEFKASPISNETFQTVTDSTLFEMMKAGAGKHVDLFMLFQTSYFRHEFKGDEKAETESHWIERDFSGVTWAYTPVTYQRMSELTGVPASTLEKQVRAFAEYRDSNGDPFVQVFNEGKLVAPKDRKQDGNVYVLNGVRLPSDRGVSKKQSQLVVQSVVQSVSHYDTPQTGSTKGENTRVSIADPTPKVEGTPPQNWRDPDANSGDLVSFIKDLSKTLSTPASESETKQVRGDIKPAQLSYLVDITSESEQRLICKRFNVEALTSLSQGQATKALSWKKPKEGVQADPDFNESMTLLAKDEAEKKRAEAEFLRQEREKQQTIEAENALIQRRQSEISHYGRELSDDEREKQRIDGVRTNAQKLRETIPSYTPVMGDHKP
jgi:hypothetical protein